MSRLTLIMGLPGSGKSHYAETRLGGTRYFNDFLHPDYRNDTTRNTNALLSWLLEGNDCVADDVSLCIPGERGAILATIRGAVPGIEVHEVYFEKNVENCLTNMLGDFYTRGRPPNFYRRINAFLNSMDRYVIPDWVATESVITPYAVERMPPLL